MKLGRTDQVVIAGVQHGATDGDSRARPAARRRSSRILKLAALGLVVAAGVWAVSANVRSGPARDMNMRVTSGNTPFPVTTAAVERGPIGGAVTYTGSVAAFNEEDIFPRVTGRIVEMAVYPGDAVRAGQVVARLDTLELSSRVGEAQASLAAAQASRAQMEADLVSAEHAITQMEKEVAMVAAELTYTRSQLARTERLFTVGAVARQELESDRAAAASGEARREAALAKVEQARAGQAAARKKLEAAESMVAQARASVGTASIVRGYADIVAPSTGYVVKRLVAPGVLVQPGMAILKTAQIDRVRLQANVGEKDLPAIRVGSSVKVMTAVAGQPPVTARVSAAFPFVDPGSRTAVVEAVVDNPGRQFLPGQYVTMEFVTGARGTALTLPAPAVSRLGPQATVWVVKEDRAEPRSVTTGLESAERVEITHGLGAGERVVVQGREGLYAGARVREVLAARADTATKGGAAPAAKPKESGHVGH